MDPRPFMTDHEMIKEIREEITGLREDFLGFKGNVVLKEELKMWEETQKKIFQYSITTTIAIVALLVAAVSVVIQTRGL